MIITFLTSLFGFSKFSVNAASQAARAMDANGVRASDRCPVLLVHGIIDDSRSMTWISRHLTATGRDVHALDLKPRTARDGLQPLAEQVAAFVAKTFPAGQKFDLVAFSMGGIVSRIYLQRLGGLDRVRRFVTISSPHRGTMLASFARGKGAREMRPRSPLLLDLASDAERLRSVGFTSIYTPLDLVIFPASSSQVPQAKTIRVWSVLHPLMIVQPSALRAIAAALEE